MRLLRPSVARGHQSCRAGSTTSTRGTTSSLVVGARVRQADARLHAAPVLAEVLPHVGHTSRGTAERSAARSRTPTLPPSFRSRSSRCDGSVVAASLADGARSPRASSSSARTRRRSSRTSSSSRPSGPSSAEGDGIRLRGARAARRRLRALHGCAPVCAATELRVVVGSVAPGRPCSRSTGAAPASRRPRRSSRGARSTRSPAYLRQLVRVLVDRAVARARGAAA